VRVLIPPFWSICRPLSSLRKKPFSYDFSNTFFLMNHWLVCSICIYWSSCHYDLECGNNLNRTLIVKYLLWVWLFWL